MGEALALYNKEAAYFGGEENLTGTLSRGKWADIVVLEKDPIITPAQDMPSCGVFMTFVGGQMVYKAT